MARDSALARDRGLVVVSEKAGAATTNSQTGQPNTEDINQQILEVSLRFLSKCYVLVLISRNNFNS